MTSRRAVLALLLLGIWLAAPALSAPSMPARDAFAGARSATDPETAAARTHADEVLRRQEYKAGRQSQGFLFRLIQVIQRGLDRLLALVRGHGLRTVLGLPLEWLVKAAVVTAAALILGLLLAAALRHARVAGREARDPAVDSGARRRLRQPADWLAAAEESARRGDFLQAVRCTFVALLGRLQAGPDALTNWEVLGRLRGDVRAPAVEAATRLYESHWYAGRAAGPADYEELLRLYRAVEAETSA